MHLQGPKFSIAFLAIDLQKGCEKAYCDDKKNMIKDKNKKNITVGGLIRSGEKAFLKAKLAFCHGTDNAWDEAVRLVAHVLNISPFSDRKVLDDEVDLRKQTQIEKLFTKRIKEKIPAAYLTNKAYLAGYEFYVNKHVMIPRSPIGEMISSQLSPWISKRKVKKILDLCTGSGCLGISAALTFPKASVDLVDISKNALKVAEKNVKKHGLQRRAKVIQSNLFDSVKSRYDVIISNPPYVGEREYARLPKEFYHEPALAFKSRNEGLEIVEKMLKLASQYLTPNGILIVEVGNSKELLIKENPKFPFIWVELQQGGDGVFLLYRNDLAVVK